MRDQSHSPSDWEVKENKRKRLGHMVTFKVTLP